MWHGYRNSHIICIIHRHGTQRETRNMCNHCVMCVEFFQLSHEQMAQGCTAISPTSHIFMCPPSLTYIYIYIHQAFQICSMILHKRAWLFCDTNVKNILWFYIYIFICNNGNNNKIYHFGMNVCICTISFMCGMCHSEWDIKQQYIYIMCIFSNESPKYQDTSNLFAHDKRYFMRCILWKDEKILSSRTKYF